MGWRWMEGRKVRERTSGRKCLPLLLRASPIEKVEAAVHLHAFRPMCAVEVVPFLLNGHHHRKRRHRMLARTPLYPQSFRRPRARVETRPIDPSPSPSHMAPPIRAPFRSPRGKRTHEQCSDRTGTKTWQCRPHPISPRPCLGRPSHFRASQVHGDVGKAR